MANKTPTTGASSISEETTMLSTQAISNTDRVSVNAPATGSIAVVDIQNANEIAFNFDLKSVRVSAIDVDLVLLFPDNSKLILPGLAMNLLGANAPKLFSLDAMIHAQDLVSSITQVNLVETTPSVHLASTDFLPKKQGGTSSNNKQSSDESEAPPTDPTQATPAIVTPVRPNPISSAISTSSSNSKVDAIEAGAIASSKMSGSSTPGEPPAPKNPPQSSSSQTTSAAKGNATFTIEAAELTIKALAIVEKNVTQQANGMILSGGSGTELAGSDPSFAAQSARESLTGSSGNDIIYADDPRFSSNGSAARLLDVTVTMPNSAITARQATISGLPAGFSILNADKIDGNWVLPVGTTKPNNFQIQLVYAIPNDAQQADANGFYKRFAMSISFDGTSASGGTGTISASAIIGVRDVNSASDQNFIDPATGQQVVVLYRNPAGNDIHGGDGNDTIYAAAGADNIDGDGGINRVDYGNSQSAVSVSLATGIGQGGFATGDHLSHIQALTGSKFADTLIGNQDDNTLAGGAGADSLDGGGGHNVADYSASNAGVTVNLSSGSGIGGDAQGDILVHFDAILGSIFGDDLTAGTTASTLYGGQGDDTLVSGIGADSLVGGEGNNTVNYRNSNAGITIDLQNHTAQGGDASGDQYSDIENISGSRFDDSIRGDSVANILNGGLGNDTLDGGIGSDTILAGGGNDSVIGGDGNDLLIADIGSSTFIGGSGNDTIDGTYGNATVDYSYATAALSVFLKDTDTSTAFISNTDRDSLINIQNIIGTSYSDIINGNTSDNIIIGGDGNDLISGGLGNDTLRGDSGADLIAGGAGDDCIDGGADNDTISGGTGNDTIDGGSGNNTLSYDYAAGGLGATITLMDTGYSTATIGTLDQDQFINIQSIIGTAYADMITANNLGVRLDGGLGNDTFIGGTGNDTLIGGGNFDVVDYHLSTSPINVNLTTGIASGTAIGIDSLQDISGVIGTVGDDTISGNNNSNFISTGDGQNIIFGSLGSDTIIGGSDIDTIDYSSLSGPINADTSLNSVTKLGAQFSIDKIQDIENVTGTAYNDTIIGNIRDAILSGGAGDDSIQSGIGNDTLLGGSGNDIIYNTSGNDLIISGLSSDLQDGADTIMGGSGNETVYSGQGADSISVGGGNDIVFGESGNDRVDLGAGNDTGDGGSGADSIFGGSGNDSLSGQDGSDTLDGGDGNDTVNAGSGNDFIIGGLGDDSLFGGADNDTLSGGYGNDTIDGDSGVNTLSFSYLGAVPGLTLMLNGSSDTTVSISDTDTDIIRNIQNIIATSGNDLLIGDAADNSLFGGAGNDTLIGSAGADTLDGGVDINTVDYSRQNYSGFLVDMTSAVTVSLAAGVVGHGGNAEGDVLVNIQNIIGSSGNDSLAGNAAANSLSGGTGQDTIDGGDGDDTLSGGDGNDSIAGGLGNDFIFDLSGSNTLVGNDGNDNLVAGNYANAIYGGTGNDTIGSGTVSSTLDGGDGNDFINAVGGNNTISAGSGNDSVNAGSGADTIDAGDGNDTISGGQGDDSILGGNGNDCLLGGDGSDTLIGGAGNDTIDGEGGSNTVSYTYATTGVTATLNSAANVTIVVSSTDTDTLSNVQNLIGTQAADSITGDGNNNSIAGYSGNDTLIGGGGRDTLDGGDGSDTVDYSYINALSTRSGITVGLQGSQFVTVTGVTVGFSGVNDGSAPSNNGADIDLIRNFENIVGTRNDDSISGDSNNNLIISGAGNDTLSGGLGNDTLTGGGDAGDIADYSYVSSTNGLTVQLNGTSSVFATVLAGSDFDVLSGIENIIGTRNDDSLVGDSANNSLFGNAGNDTLNGGTGSDYLVGGDGNDLYILNTIGTTVFENAGEGIDEIQTQISNLSLVNFANIENLTFKSSGSFTGSGNELNNTIKGNVGNDSLFGDIGNDSLFGSDGNDTLDGGVGADTLAGGNQNDVYYVDSNLDVIIEYTNGGNDREITTFNSITLAANVETLEFQGIGNFTGIGTNDSNTIIGASGNDSLSGLDGNDYFIGNDGSDTISGGAGSDTIDYSYVTTSSGLSIALNGATAVTISTLGSTDRDVISEIENIVGTKNADYIVGDNEANSLAGGLGNDTLSGGANNDTIDGGGGSDTIDYSYVTGNSGLTIALNGSNLVTAIISANSDVDLVSNIENIIGTKNSDRITGDLNDNVIAGGLGNDTIDGAGGRDTLDYSYVQGPTGVSLTLSGATPSVAFIAPNDSDLISNFENIIGTNSADTIFGDAEANSIFGGNGNDLLSGGVGNDTLVGGSGNVTVDYSYASANSGVSVQLNSNGTTTATLIANSDTDQLVKISNLIGTQYSDSVAGDDNANRVDGGSGSDTLIGNGGDDTLIGGLGNDSLDGGSGNDLIDYSYVTGATGLTVSLNGAGAATVTGLSATDIDLIRNVENITGTKNSDSISGDSSDNILLGADGNDTLSGGAGNDVLSGGTGDDVLNGGDGANTLSGGAGNDIYYVNSAADMIIEAANQGTDTIRTGMSQYSLANTDLANIENLESLSTSSATLSGNALDNIIRGSASAASSLSGASGNDTLYGGSGHDTLDGGTGVDSLIGGDGNDVYIINDSTDVIFETANGGIDLISTTLSTIDLSNANYQNVESILFTSAANSTGTGSASDNTITGGSGSDLLSGNAGNDCLVGGSGNNTLDGGTGDDTLVGGSGNDVFVIDSASDTVIETNASSIDTIQTSLTAFDLSGSNFSSIENLAYTGAVGFNGRGNALANSISGGSGNDTLEGGGGADTINGNGGIDTASYSGSLTAVTVNLTTNTGTGGDAEGDLLIGITNVRGALLAANSLIGDANANQLTGGALNDSLSGGAGSDTLSGAAGNDTLDGGGQNDTLVGGAGDDTYITNALGAVITESTGAGGGTDTIQTSLSAFDLSGANYANVENLVYTGSGQFTGTGSSLDNVITGSVTNANSLAGGLGNDCLIGGSANDTLDGGGQNDTLVGGQGNDLYIINTLGAAITELAGGGTDTIQTSLSTFDLSGANYANVENLAYTGSGSFTGTGSSLNNVITGSTTGLNSLSGGAGNDCLVGGSANDTLDGGTGNDTLSGGLGNDLYLVDSLNDSISEIAGGGTDTIQLVDTSGLTAYTLASGNNIENLIYVGANAFTLSGNELDNTITGSSSAGNSLSGGLGNDCLVGGSGSDTLDGGGQNDTLVGGAGNDTYIINALGAVITESTGAGGGTDTIQTSLSTFDLSGVNYANVENLAYTGNGAFTGIGSTGDNSISGGALNDSLDGGAGNDTLRGGSGIDTLFGGAGNDLIIGNNGNAWSSGGTNGNSLSVDLGATPFGTNASNGYTLTYRFQSTDQRALDSFVVIGNVGAPDACIHIGLRSSGQLTLAQYFDDYNITPATNILDGSWHTITATVTGTRQATLYLDGVAIGSTTLGGNYRDAASNILTINSSGVTSSSGRNAAYDDVAVYNRALSATEVQTLTNYGANAVSTNQLALYNFDGPNAFADTTGQKGNLTQNGSQGIITADGWGDSLSGGADQDTIQGTAGNDTLDGGTGNDSLVGGTGNDLYIVDSINDTVSESAGAGIDTIRVVDTSGLTSYSLAANNNVENLIYAGTNAFTLVGNELANTITGGSGANSLSGGAGNDCLVGGAVADTLDGGAGSDTLAGGLGDDFYVVDSLNDSVIEAASSGNDTIQLVDTSGLAAYTLTSGSNVENLIYTGTNLFTLVGNEIANTITGSSSAGNSLSGGGGNDYLYAGMGNDTLDGGTGNDTLFGGVGDDVYIVNSLGALVIETAGGGTDIIQTSLSTLALSDPNYVNVENLTYTGSSAFTGAGSSSDNTIAGGSGANSLFGGTGNDCLVGGASNDTLDGGTGADTMSGGAGNDFYLVENPNDSVVEAAGGGIDTIQVFDTWGLSSYSLAAGNNVENLTYAGTSAFTLSGNELANTITGSSNASNSLSGGAGNDCLIGGTGNDTLDSGTGNDTLAGGLGNDVYIINALGPMITETAGGGIDTIQTTLSTFDMSGTNYTNVENLTYTGSSAFTGTGSALDNVITGSTTGANSLSGGLGNDRLIGGSVADTLDGGSGADTLIGGLGNDSLVGGADLKAVADYSYVGIGAASALTSGITVQLSGGSATVTVASGLDVDTLTNIENITGTQFADSLAGDANANSLNGGSGNDTLSGGLGNDTLDGGAGTDLVDYSYYTSGVTLTASGQATASGSNTFTFSTGGADNDVLTNIESIKLGSGNNTVNLQALTSTFYGMTINGSQATSDSIIGSAAADSILGSSGNDTLSGGAGANTIDGGSGINTVTYANSLGAVNISLISGGGANGWGQTDQFTNIQNIIGSSYNDILVGNIGVNLIDGGAGNDTIIGYEGADTLIGGSGIDTVDYSYTGGVTTGITLDLNLTIAQAAGGLATGDVISGFENVVGTNLNDSIAGNGSDNSLSGGSGNDTLSGGVGNDTLDGGGGGADIVDYSYVTNGVTLNLSSFDTTSWQTVTINAGSDVDVVRNFTGLTGGLGNDSIIGDSAANYLSGYAGDDTLISIGGADTLIGGLGNDSLVGGADLKSIVDYSYVGTGYASAELSGITVQLSGGSATVTVAAGIEIDKLANIEMITGTQFADSVAGDANANSLSGGAGNDTLVGGLGNDTLDGGTGNDLIDYSYVAVGTGGITIQLNGSTTASVTGLGASDADLVSNIENIIGTQNNDCIGGDSNANSLAGGAGNDCLVGNAGDDTLDGGTGADTMSGGVGNDLYIVDNVNDAVSEVAGGGIDTINLVDTAGLTAYTLAAGNNVENLTYAGTSAFTIAGNELDNTITGSSSAGNSLSGGAGNDCLIGGTGNDTLDGGGQSDILIGGAGNDLYVINTLGAAITENVAGGTDTIQTSLSAFDLSGANYTNVENLTSSGSSAFTGIGSSLNNVITGSTTGVNSLSGGGGNDCLIGGSAADTLDGGGQSDTLAGGAGNDLYIINTLGAVITENIGGGIDTIQTSLGAFDMSGANYTNVENLTYTGSGAFTGTGSSLDNVITGSTTGVNSLSGGAGNDCLIGGAGNDTLDGGTGNDTLSGGAGNDLYIIDSVNDSVVEAAGQGIDTINLVDTVGLTAYTLAAGSNIEYLTYAGANAFTIAGNELDNTITGSSSAGNSLSGGAGNDCLIGGAGNDTLDGGTGNDTLAGGTGNDLYIVDSINDTVSEAAGGGIDTIKLVDTSGLAAYTLASGNNVENLIYSGANAFTLAGNELANTITGSSSVGNSLSGGLGNDCLIGGTANDTLDGGTGNDSLVGGAGNDLYIVDNANDSVSESAGGGTDTIQTSLSTFDLSRANYANVENLTYAGNNAFTGTGSTGDNSISGGALNDSLSGGAGNDTLFGGTLSNLISDGTALNGNWWNYNMTTTPDNLADPFGGMTADTTLAQGGFVKQDLPQTVFTPGLPYTFSFYTKNIDTVGSTSVNIRNFGWALSSSSISMNWDGATLASVDSWYPGTTNFTSVGNGWYRVTNTFTGLDYSSRSNPTVYFQGQSNQRFSVWGVLLEQASQASPYTNGDDTLDGGTGNDLLIGGYGNDVYIVDSNNDTVSESAGQGTDTIQVIDTSGLTSYTLAAGNNVENLTYAGANAFTIAGNELDNTITGSSSAGNSLSGGAGNDCLIGGAGNDTLDGGGQSDTLVGGAGNDVYVINTLGAAITENVAGGTDTIQTSLSAFDMSGANYANVENLTYTGSSAFTGTGSALDNVITGSTTGVNSLSGGLGNDCLVGGAAADTLDGGGQSDTLAGGAGNDLYIINTLGAVITENIGGGIDTIQTSLGAFDMSGANYTNVENLTYTGSGAFTGTGSALDNVITGSTTGANSLSGGLGNDCLVGGSANDTLDGGTGNDTLAGGAGNDLYIVDNLFDSVSESASQGTDTIQVIDTSGLTSYTLASGNNVENLTYTGANAFTIAGNELDNTITGSSSAGNSLSGGAGNDCLIGGTGNDTLDGGGQSDTLVGGAGNDVYVINTLGAAITENIGGGTDTIQTSLGAFDMSGANYTNVENLTYTGSGAFTGTGSSLDNVITGSTTGANSLSGGAGNDCLVGGSAADTLDGGTGNDTLAGGAGNDYYILDTTSDTINEGTSAGIDTAKLASSGAWTTYTLATNVENLDASSLLSGINITGNISDNSMTGSAYADTIDGYGGNDTIKSGAGDDIIKVRGTTAWIDGGSGNNQVQLYALGNTPYQNSDTFTSSAGGWTGGSLKTFSGTYNTGEIVYSGPQATNAPITKSFSFGQNVNFVTQNFDFYVLNQFGTAATAGLMVNGQTIVSFNITGGSTLVTGTNYILNAQYIGTGRMDLNDPGWSGGVDGLYKVTFTYALDTPASTYTFGTQLSSRSTSEMFFGVDNFNLSTPSQIVNGYTGTNTVDYSNLGSGLSVNLTSTAPQNGQSLFGIANLTGTQFADTFIGGSENNIFIGGAGNNSLSGGNGADSLLGGTDSDILSGGVGNDTLDGGAGIDTADYSYLTSATSGFSATLNSTGSISVTVAAGSDVDTLMNIENITGGTGNDTLNGDAYANVINGGGGNDSLSGNAGNDTILGGLGSDTLDGGSGNDTADYSYVTSSGTTDSIHGITVTLNGATAASVTGLATGDQDTIQNVENIIGTSFNDSIGGDSNANSLFGGSGDDTLSGSGNNDTLDGGAGNDSLIGTGGIDSLVGGAGNDYMLVDQSFLGGGRIDGGAGSDTVSFAASSGNLTLTSANFSNVVTNTEVLDFTAVGTNVTMSLNASDISSITGQALTAGSTAKLDIFQNAGDSISMAAQAGYTYDTSTTSGVTTYTLYNSTDPHDAAHQLAQLIVH